MTLFIFAHKKFHFFNFILSNFLVRTKRNFYKDLSVVIACLVVGVSCFLLIECVVKVTRKELLEWSNILLPLFFSRIFIFREDSFQFEKIVSFLKRCKMICIEKNSFTRKIFLEKRISHIKDLVIITILYFKYIIRNFSKSNSLWLCTYYTLWLTHHFAPANLDKISDWIHLSKSMYSFWILAPFLVEFLTRDTILGWIKELILIRQINLNAQQF